MSNEPIELVGQESTESARGETPSLVHIDEHAFIPGETEETLSYSDQLNSMVKVNHHKLTLEKELLKAKAYFKNRTKNELLDLLFSMDRTLPKSARKPMRNNSKTALIELVIKGWMKHKQNEIETKKALDQELVANPETEQALDNAIDILGIAFESNTYLPDSPKWDGTLWELALDSAISQGYKTIKTLDGSRYKIVNRDQVISIPLSNNDGNVVNRNEEL